MEYVMGKISLSIIFRLYWVNYDKWYTGNIREVVYEKCKNYYTLDNYNRINILKILKISIKG